MNEVFPHNIKIGALEVFKEELVKCFDDCVNERWHQLDKSIDLSSVVAFLPLLLNKVFALSRMSLATIFNDPSNKESATTKTNAQAINEIHAKYPVLKQKIQIASQNWKSNTNNIIQRWQHDKKEIARCIFAVEEIGHIVSLGACQGDEHAGGQQTLLIELSCGRKIAYKPRNLLLEKSFYEFAEQLGFFELYQPKYLSRKHYGWMEYIPHNQCENTTQLADYYYQAGLILSLLYALEAEDIHHENIIARGSQPVLIDLETLFHHRDDSVGNSSKNTVSLNLGNHTVLKTHFIPQYLSLDPEKELAAIFPVYEKQTPAISSFPKLEQQSVAVDNYTNDFIHGFKTGYSRLVANKSVLLNTDGPFNLFNGCVARYVCRPTRTYHRLIQASSHPIYLQCPSKQASLFEKLKLDLVGRKFLGALISVEESQLSKAEIPLFTHRVDQKSVWKGEEVVKADYFSLTGLDLSRKKISNMNDDDLDGQVRSIKQSFDLVNPLPDILRPEIIIEKEMSFKSLCENAAYSIGQFIVNQGLHHQGGKIWPLFKFDGVDRTCLEPTNSSLYDGYLGIQLFLANLQIRFPDLCERQELIKQTRVGLDLAIDNFSEHDGCGFSGLGGVLYALSKFTNLWPDEEWIKERGLRVLNLMQTLPANDDKLDITGGSAGAILSLLSYFKQSAEHQALNVAYDFGKNLLKHFQCEGEFGWQISDGKVLSGFAHGNAGIGYALLTLAQLTPNKNFTRCALAAMEYESNQYSPDIGNWPDKRFDTEDEQNKQAMTAWCHSAVGIGMSRLGLIKNTNTLLPAFIDGDVDRALAHLSSRPIINDEGLCHGNFGNFELLVMARLQGLLNVEVESQAQERIIKQIELIAENGIAHENGNVITSLSLMNGWAGIGYQILRFLQPDKTPNILLMES